MQCKFWGHIFIEEMVSERRKTHIGCRICLKKGHPTEPPVVLFCAVLHCGAAQTGVPLFSYSNPQLFSEDRTKTQKPISRKYLILNCWFWCDWQTFSNVLMNERKIEHLNQGRAMEEAKKRETKWLVPEVFWTVGVLRVRLASNLTGCRQILN